MKTVKLFAVAFLLSAPLFAQNNVKTIDLEQTTGEFKTKELKLKPGTYKFQVTNVNVDHAVGFVLAPKQDDIQAEDHIKAAYLSKTIGEGETASSGEVTLAKGEYVYFCPLNPTPHYVLKVE